MYPMLAAAGAIGMATAIFHGILTHRLMVDPLNRLLGDGKTMSVALRRLIPLLLQFSTYSWLLCGIALVAVAFGWQPGARLAISLMVGATYLYAALANAWGTRGRHPGWMLMAVAVMLIGVDLVRTPG